ncbi:MAG: hypothetical protein ABSA15_06735, partial [Thermoplasmata archaeon]
MTGVCTTRPGAWWARSGPARFEVVALVVLLVASSLLFVPAASTPPARSIRAETPSGPVRASPSSAACGSSPSAPGDLVVGPGTGPCVIEQSVHGSTYVQSGNVTVLPGGILIVRNITLSIRQYVSDSGTPMQRLSHIYTFHDEGTVQFWNATLTTDATL